MFSSGSDLPYVYTGSENMKLAVNSLPGIEENEIISLGFKAGLNGSYTLSFSGAESFGESVNIYLRDLKNDLLTNLKNTYTYNFDYSAEDNEFRFELIFSGCYRYR